VKTCTAGTRGTNCGLKWTEGGNDGSLGVGEQMAALEVVQGLLVNETRGWVSEVKGTGSSQGDASAGTADKTGSNGAQVVVITMKDKVGAGILTMLILMSVVGGSVAILVS